MDIVSSGSSINGISQFGSTFMDLQENFCCWDLDNRHIIRWIGCNPSIYKNNKNVFSAADLAFCNWYQVVDSYQFTIVEMAPEALVEVALNSKYLMMKAIWPTGTTGPLESAKTIEVQINEQAGYVGSTLPFNIQSPSPARYNTYVMKDVFTLNSESLLTSNLILNNISAYTVDVAILYAK